MNTSPYLSRGDVGSLSDPPLCVYHSADLDGKCSGVIVKQFVPDVEMFPYDYGQPFPFEKCEGRVVIMVDVSLPMNQMKRVKGVSRRFVWIDHHTTALDDAIHAGFNTEGSIEIGTAACILTWRYFAPPHRNVPRAVELLGRYDVWDHSHPDILPFQYGMRGAIKHGVDDAIWKVLLSPPETTPDRIITSHITELVQQGRLILNYQATSDAISMEEAAYEVEFEGLTLLMANSLRRSSQLFDSRYNKDHHDVMCRFALYADGKWRFSLYSTKDDVHVGELARLIGGGGGHKGAAGFELNNLPAWALP